MTATKYIVRFTTANGPQSTKPVGADLRDRFVAVAHECGFTDVRVMASGPQGPILSAEQLEDIRRHLANGADAAVKIEQSGPGVWLILTNEYGLDIDWYHVLDADGPSQLEREQALDEATERLAELGIDA